MRRDNAVRWLVFAATLYAVALLQSGCATPTGELSQGQKWYLEIEAEKARLNAMGFTQYSDD